MITVSTLRAHIIYLVGFLLEQTSPNFIWVNTSNNEFDVCIFVKRYVNVNKQ